MVGEVAGVAVAGAVDDRQHRPGREFDIVGKDPAHIPGTPWKRDQDPVAEQERPKRA